MRKNMAKEKLKSGETIIGTFCELDAPALVEVVGHLGFDFVVIDAEHGPMDVTACGSLVMAADNVGLTPIVRVAMNVQQNILRYLDVGALGVQMPMINTKEDAEAVVRSVKYPPVGRRGLAPVRAADYGLTTSLSDYVRMANEETMIITHVETLDAVENLPDMLAVSEIDVVFIGPTDLSSSMGYPGEFKHPEVQSMIEKLGRQIQDRGKAAGVYAGNAEDARRYKQWGFRYITTGVMKLLAQGGQGYLEMAR